MPEPNLELGFVFSAVRRFWLLVLVYAVLGGAAGFFWSKSQPIHYESTATLVVRSPTTDLGPTATGDADRYVGEQVSILSGPTVASVVAQQFTGETAISIQRSVVVTSSTGSDVVTVLASGDTPDKAASVANAVANAFLKQEAATAAPSTDLKNELTTTGVEINNVLKQLTDYDVKHKDDTARASIERDALTISYNRLLDKKTKLESAAKITVESRLIESARPSAVPIGGVSKVLGLAAGLIGGLLMGSSFAIVAGRFSRYLIDESQIRSITGERIDAKLLDPGCRRFGFLPRSNSSLASSRDSISRLVVKIQIFANSDDISVAVCSTQPGSDAGLLAATLSARLAESFPAVTLVEHDPDEAVNDEIFKRCIQTLSPLGASVNRTWADGSTADETAYPQAATQTRRPSGAEYSIPFQGGASVHNLKPLPYSAEAAQILRDSQVAILVVPARRQRLDSLQLSSDIVNESGTQKYVVITNPRRLRRHVQ